jgi:hypothetical protein
VWDFLHGLEGLELKLDGIVYGKVVEAGITSGEFDVQALVEVKNPKIVIEEGNTLTIRISEITPNSRYKNEY